MKDYLAFGFKLLLSLLFTLVLFEVGLRFVPHIIPLNLLVLFNEDIRTEIALKRGLPTKEDTTLIERDDEGPEIRIYKPFTERTWYIQETGTTVTAMMDEMGFCNLPQNSYQLPAIDIITLGDSFTACHAVSAEETWSTQLSKQMGYTVYNLGKIGIGLHEHIQLLKKFGLAKSPKIVIINVYEGNDLRDASHYYEFVHHKEAVEKAESSIGRNFLGKYSYVANLIFATIQYVNDNYFDPKEAKTPVNFKYQLVFSGENVIPFNPENVDTDEVRYAMYLTTLQTAPEIFQVVDEVLQTFVDLSKQYDFIPIITYTPSAHTTYIENVVFEDPKLTGLMKSFSYEQRQYLKRKGNELGYIFIDLTPSLQSVAQMNGPEKLLYYQHDLHLTPAGHAAVAEIISRELQQLEIEE